MINCPKCGKELPDKSSFCLDCFTDISGGNTAVATKSGSAAKLLSAVKSRTMKIALSCMLFVALASTGALILKDNMKKPETVAADSTTLVAVTDEAGEAVTNESGEAIMAAMIEVTDESGESVTGRNGAKVYKTVVPVTTSDGENVTDKNGEQIFEVVEDKTEQSSSTTRQSILNRLFGNDDKDTTTKAPETTKKPPQTTKKNDPYETSTTKAPSTSVTQTSETTSSAPVPTTDQTSVQASDGDFEYDTYNGYIRIKKYTGNAKSIIVPAEINGTPVGYLSTGAFPASTESLTFSGDIFDLGYSTFKQNPNLEAVNFKSSSKYKVVDGVVFYSDNSLCFYPMGKKTANYTLPSFCTRLSSNSIRDNPYIKTFSFSAENSGMYLDSQMKNFMGCSALTAINTYKNTDKVKSVDGILYFMGVGTASNSYMTLKGYTVFVFPAGKQVSNYEFPDDREIFINDDAFCGNPYLTSVRFRNRVLCASIVHVYNSQYAPKNLKKFTFPDDDAMRSWYNENQYYFNAYGLTVEFK